MTQPQRPVGGLVPAFGGRTDTPVGDDMRALSVILETDLDGLVDALEEAGVLRKPR